VRLAGTQGVELIMWLVMRGALSARVNTIHRHYHIPVSNTAAGVVLEGARRNAWRKSDSLAHRSEILVRRSCCERVVGLARTSR
jgi:hypothetical protein